ncbi:arylesterase [Betaproteobacteria bacterium SCN1]|jgi:lysophospholipase L1-like esterase|nr:arylesterase [Betaproteobacteria bacterium SCN1]MBN8760301.1 arylesterase [Thiobacillus sp.]ODU90033.1 MAG: arylesterase [Thiobacillus sp. SCN 65-179]OJW39646.1 MAG: arylesterase [Thiobacillus sp. 65-69]
MTHPARLLAGFLLAFFLAACEQAPTLPKLSAHDIIVAFGDSLTHGTGASADTAYPAVLSTLTGHTVINAGVPGNTTADGLARLPDVLAEYKPRLVLLCLGGNDMLRRVPETETENNLRLLVRTIRAAGAEVVLVGVPEPKLFGGAPAFYEKLAGELQVPLEQDVFVEVLKDNRLKSDPIHANAEGYRVVAERLAGFLREAGAL